MTAASGSVGVGHHDRRLPAREELVNKSEGLDLVLRLESLLVFWKWVPSLLGSLWMQHRDSERKVMRSSGDTSFLFNGQDTSKHRSSECRLMFCGLPNSRCHECTNFEIPMQFGSRASAMHPTFFCIASRIARDSYSLCSSLRSFLSLATTESHSPHVHKSPSCCHGFDHTTTRTRFYELIVKLHCLRNQWTKDRTMLGLALDRAGCVWHVRCDLHGCLQQNVINCGPNRPLQ